MAMPAYINPTVSQTVANTQTPVNTGGTNTGTGGGYDSLLSSLIGTGINIYGTQNAAEAATKGNEGAISTQQGTLGNINSLFGAQTGVGNAAFSTLGSTLGVNGQPANYSNFLNMPGYNFAVGAGTQAIERAAAANGSLYTPNTLANIGQYVTGTAMQDYNTYVSQLMGAAGFGAQANQVLSGANLSTGANISQLQANIGQNQAGGYAGVAGFLGGANSSGVSGNAGVSNGIASLLGKGLNYLNSPSGSGGGNASGNGGDMTGGVYNGGAFGGGAPLYDPNTGAYPGDSSTVGNITTGDPFYGNGDGGP